MQGEERRIVVTDGVNLYDATRSYTGSGIECIEVTHSHGPIPSDTYRTQIYAGGLLPIKTLLWHVRTGGPGEIIFSSSRGGNPLDIYIMNEDGSDVRRLTNAPGYNEFAKVSHAARRVVFQSTRTGTVQAYIMDIDGSNARQLTTNCGESYEPSWSPDDTRIIFGCDGYLAFINPDGSQLEKTSIRGGAPDWSPAGTKIALVRWMSSDGDWEIFVVDVDGSNETRLTQTPNAEWYPAWSPDGSKIVFGYVEGPSHPVYTMNADGSNRTRITDIDIGSVPAPRWSPDGQQIVFMSDQDGNKEIYVMNSDGSNQIRLTNNPARDDSPFWFVVSPSE